jgi:hypothetical protein
MSGNQSWKASYQSYAEVAIEVVRECASVLRSRGLKTDTALRDLAPELGITHRRVRTLFHRDGIPVVLKNEWMQLRYRAGLLFLNEAERLRNLADRYEEKGNDLVSGQMELPWEITTNTSQRRCA